VEEALDLVWPKKGEKSGQGQKRIERDEKVSLQKKRPPKRERYVRTNEVRGQKERNPTARPGGAKAISSKLRQKKMVTLTVGALPGGRTEGKEKELPKGEKEKRKLGSTPSMF